MKLKNKVALVTGAGRGIGKAIALAYVREGAKMAICARTGSEVEQTASEIRHQGTDCLGLVCDVSVEESVVSLVKEVERCFGRIDVLVNNAGVMTRPIPAIAGYLIVTGFDMSANFIFFAVPMAIGGFIAYLLHIH